MTLKQKLINAYSSLGVGETVAVSANGTTDIETQLSMFLSEFTNCTARIEKRGTPDYLASNYVVLTKTSIPIAPMPVPAPTPSPEPEVIVTPEPEDPEVVEESSGGFGISAKDVISKFRLKPDNDK